MSQKTVFCKKLQKEAPGLEEPPFADDLGVEIFENVSAEAWGMWKDDMMIKIINEYRLNLAEAKDYNTLLEQMRTFLGLAGEGESLEVGNAERGQS